MKIIGIDAGGSSTKIVLINGEIKYLFSEKNPVNLKKIKEKIRKFKNCPIAITGGGAKRIAKSLNSKRIKIIDEIKALGLGGIYLTKKNKAFIVSIGTGTAMVAVNKDKIIHAGGTGFGGGTLWGLSQLIFKNKDLDLLEKLAKNGERKKIDLTVKDIVGSSIGKVPADATASNFGKLNSKKNEDLTAGLFNFLAEVIATLSYFAAKNYRLENEIIFCGRVAKNKIIKRRIKETVKMWGGRAEIPKMAEYVLAIGAAKSLTKRWKS